MTEWVTGRAEVEVVDMVLRLRGKLLQHDNVLSQPTAESLKYEKSPIIFVLLNFRVGAGWKI